VNGKFYIGSAINIKKRWSRHKRDLDKGAHHSKYLQRSWELHGEPSFYFGVLEPVEDKGVLVAREQFWIGLLKPEYNVCPTAGSCLGRKWSDETNQKMSGKNHPNYKKAKCWEYKGKSQPVSAWAKEYNLSREALKDRLEKLGWPIEKALLTPMETIGKGEANFNYKRAKRYEYNGKFQPLSCWAREYNIKQTTLASRVKRSGWSLERALLTSVFSLTGENNYKYQQAKRWEYNGKSQSLSAWAAEYGLATVQLNNRVNRWGWSLERALTTSVKKGSSRTKKTRTKQSSNKDNS